MSVAVMASPMAFAMMDNNNNNNNNNHHTNVAAALASFSLHHSESDNSSFGTHDSHSAPSSPSHSQASPAHLSQADLDRFDLAVKRAARVRKHSESQADQDAFDQGPLRRVPHLVSLSASNSPIAKKRRLRNAASTSDHDTHARVFNFHPDDETKHSAEPAHHDHDDQHNHHLPEEADGILVAAPAATSSSSSSVATAHGSAPLPTRRLKAGKKGGAPALRSHFAPQAIDNSLSFLRAAAAANDSTSDPHVGAHVISRSAKMASAAATALLSTSHMHHDAHDHTHAHAHHHDGVHGHVSVHAAASTSPSPSTSLSGTTQAHTAS